MSDIENILSNCAGVEVEKTKNTSYGGWSQEYNYKFHKVGDIKVHDNVFIEIIKTAAKGTIAKVVGLEVDTYSERYPTLEAYATDNSIVTYGCTLIYEVEGRKQKGRIKSQYVKVLVGQHETKYVRTVNKHEKVVVKNPVNKYKQEMQRGDWVIGSKRGNSLGIGRITRWTNHNVWAVTGNDLDDKSKEFQFASITETFTMPDDKHVQMLTMAVLKGWSGN